MSGQGWSLRVEGTRSVCGSVIACNECFSLESLWKLSLALYFSLSAKLISCVSSVSQNQDEGQLMNSLKFKVTRLITDKSNVNVSRIEFLSLWDID